MTHFFLKHKLPYMINLTHLRKLRDKKKTENGNEQPGCSNCPDLPDFDVADHVLSGGVLRAYHVFPYHISISMLAMSTPTAASL